MEWGRTFRGMLLGRLGLWGEKENIPQNVVVETMAVVGEGERRTFRGMLLWRLGRWWVRGEVKLLPSWVKKFLKFFWGEDGREEGGKLAEGRFDQ